MLIIRELSIVVDFMIQVFHDIHHVFFLIREQRL